VDIDAKASSSAKGLQVVNAQIATSERDKRVLELTLSELAKYSTDTSVYLGVGKM
jgi:hypothetical protein